MPVSRDPLECFSHFFNDQLLIVEETNRYAAQCLEGNRESTWETDVAELKAYFGIMIVMGVNKLPEIRDYWSLDSKLNNAYISSRITLAIA